MLVDIERKLAAEEFHDPLLWLGALRARWRFVASPFGSIFAFRRICLAFGPAGSVGRLSVDHIALRRLIGYASLLRSVRRLLVAIGFPDGDHLESIVS